MRNLLLPALLVFVAGAALAEDKTITIKPALQLSVPSDAKVTAKGEQTTILAKHLQIYIWELPKAKSVAEVVPHVGEVIKSEFVKYEVKATDSLKVAGHEAKHVKGTGEEADDNDPGSAEVVIFTDGKHVYAACVHGERDEAAKERPALLKVLESAKVL